MKNLPTHSCNFISQTTRLACFFTNRLNLFFLAAVLFLPVFSLRAQAPPALQWEAHYGSNSNDTSKNVLPTSDGGYLLVGRIAANTGDVVGSGYLGNSDGWVTKLNASGTIAWKKAYGTTGTDKGIQQAIEVSDGYVLVGSRYFSGGVSTDKVWYAKVSKTDGSINWEREYNSTFQSLGYAIASTPDGYLVGGETADGGRKALLLRTNSTGIVTTTYTSNPAGGLWGQTIVQIEKTPDNGYLLLGRHYDSAEPGCNPQTEVPDPFDLWMCKFSGTYAAVWSTTYGGTTTDHPRDVVVTQGGDIFALGNTGCTGAVTGPNNIGRGDWVLHTNSAGVLQQVEMVSLSNFDNTRAIYGIGLSCDDQILICGQTGGLLGTTAVVIKMTTDFNIIWSFYTDPSVDITRTAYDVVKTGNNGYIVVGLRHSASKLSDFYAARLAPDPGCESSASFCDKAVTVTCGQYLAAQSTAAETNSITTYPCVSNGTFSGKDKVYKIVLSQTSDLQVGLEIVTNGLNLDLFLLSNNCTTVICLDTSLTNNSITRKEGIVKSLPAGTYYVVVDGLSSTATGSFNIDFACGELICNSPAPTALTCGTPYSSTTVGYPNNVSIYKQTPSMADDVPSEKIDVNNAGPERLHQFTIAQQSTVTVTLSGLSANVDLEMFLLNSCSKNNCIAKSTNGVGQNEVITMQLNAGTYYVSVDGFRNNAGAYTLTVDCGNQPNPASDLTFDIDDNVCGGSNTVVHVPVRVRNFTNVTTFEMSVAVTNGSIAQLESIQPGTLPGTLDYVVSNSTTGLLLWYNFPPVTVADNTVICTLAVRVTGSASATSTLNITGNPISIYAEQSIAGVLTSVTPVVAGGSVCVSANYSISGIIQREDNAGVGNVKVQLSGSSTQIKTTDSQGAYTFSALPAGGNYVITPVKDTADRNGVNGSDLVAIQRHILGISPLVGAYKRIAADANNSKSINGSDLVAIQRLILQIDQTLPLNTSWQFVGKSHVFTDPNNPWTPAYPQTLTYNNLSANITNADFTGVKIADVNVSNNPLYFGYEQTEDRKTTKIQLETDDVADAFSEASLGFNISNDTVQSGQIFELDVRTSNFTDVFTFQFSIGWDSSILDFDTLVAYNTTLPLTAANFNFILSNGGKLAMNWYDVQNKTLPEDALLFKLKFRAVATGTAAVRFSNEPAEIFAEGVSGIMTVDTTNGVVSIVPNGPVNDQCVGAVSIQNLFGNGAGNPQTSPVFDNTNATTNASDPASGHECFYEEAIGNPSGLDNSLWFKFTGDGQHYRITTVQCGLTGSDYITAGDAQIAVYKGVCGNLVPVDCNEDISAGSANYAARIADLGAAQSEDYYILIDGCRCIGANSELASGQFCIQVEQLTSVANQEPASRNKLVLFPNPTQDRANLQFELLANQEIGIFITDHLGRPVRTVLPPRTLSAGTKNISVELAGLPSGLYFLVLDKANGKETLKVTKI